MGRTSISQNVANGGACFVGISTAVWSTAHCGFWSCHTPGVGHTVARFVAAKLPTPQVAKNFEEES